VELHKLSVHALKGTAIGPAARKYRFAALGGICPSPAKRGSVASAPNSRALQGMDHIHGVNDEKPILPPALKALLLAMETRRAA